MDAESSRTSEGDFEEGDIEDYEDEEGKFKTSFFNFCGNWEKSFTNFIISFKKTNRKSPNSNFSKG